MDRQPVEGILGRVDGQRSGAIASRPARRPTGDRGQQRESSAARRAARPGTSARVRAGIGRSSAATKLASATGIRLRGFHSKSSSSTASRTAAIGVAKVADIPPAAPATSSVFRSAAVRWNAWATSEPIEPARHDDRAFGAEGPPEPIEIAEETGLSTATLGCIRLWPIRIASIASGMPCPRIRSEP